MSPIIGSFASGGSFGGRGGKAPIVQLYPFSTASFISTRYGSSGPSLTEVRNGLSGPEVDSWKNDTNFLNVSGGIIRWTVPNDGVYRIEAWGSKGKAGYGSAGGFGSRMRGDFELTEGEIIRILVGQEPEHTGVYGPPSPYGGGGGGGTYVTKSPHNTTASILLVAGGGGGGSRGNYPGANAPTAVGPTAGNGGGTSTQHGGMGGGGFFGNGPRSRPNAFYGLGGVSYTGGGLGGEGSTGYGAIPGIPAAILGEGGFGGGGGCDHHGAGGGGYNGGAAGNYSTGTAGGGTSYNSGSNQSNSVGSSTDGRPSYGGKVTITLIS